MKEAIRRLDEAGHIAYLVGGSVRDFLLSRVTKDHDIATSADPDELCTLFPRALTVGKQFGVIKVPVDLGEGKSKILEIASFREDLEYRDNRHPTGVLFSGPAEDARRRDFSVNALFYDLKTHRILDTVKGMEDLQGRVIRAIGDPEQRFQEDALRLLRAVRFTANLDFTLEPLTAAAIRKCARLIKKVSAERIRDEFTGMLSGPKPGFAFRMLSELGLLPFLMSDLEALKGVRQPPTYHFEGDVWEFTLRVLDNLARQDPLRPAVLNWAALWHEIGKPQALKLNNGKNFNGHEQLGSQLARHLGERLKMSRQDIQSIGLLIEDQLKFRSVFEMREATLKRWLAEAHFENSLALHRATALVSDGNLAFYEFCASRFQEARKGPASLARLIDGEDLIQLGLDPSPKFSKILRAVEDLALENKLKTKDQALEYVLKHFVK